ncbi:MAG: trigger factor [candidate division WOR-3 bacterium]
MNYQIVNESEVEKEVEFLLSHEDFKPAMDEETERLRKKVAIKGYRKGRAPKNVVHSLYQNTIRTNALNKLIAKFYSKLLEEKKWRPATEPELLNVEDGEEIKFRLRIEVIPDFDVKNYLGLELLKNKPLPSDYLFEEAMNNLRERYATIRETNESAAVDSFVTMDMEIIRKDEVQEQKKDIVVRVGDRSLPDEINRLLVGAKKGERKEIKIQDLLYKISIKKIEEKILPQIDDNFAHSLNCKDIKELEEKVRKAIEKDEENRLKEELEESLAQILLERNQFPVPKTLINFEYQMILKENNLTDSEANRERFWDIAEKRARLNLILEKIAEKEGINTPKTEVVALLKREDSEINEDRKGYIEYLQNLITRRKTMEFLLKNAIVSERERIVSPREVDNVNRTIRY